MFQLLKNTKIFVWGMILVMAAGWCMAASVCIAEDAVKAVKDIKQPPSLNTPIMQQEMPRKPSYSLEGTLDAVGEDWITVNDFQISLAPGASINCSVGEFVGIRVNDEGKAISCERIPRSKR